MKYVIAIWTLLFSVNVFAQTVVLRWGSNPGAGQITVVNGELEKINSRGGKIQKNRFDLSSAANKELWLTVGKAQNEVGPKATVVNVLMDNEKSFSFFLRDVSSGYPIYIPAYGVTVLPRGDNRSYAQVEHDVLSRKRFTKIEKIEEEILNMVYNGSISQKDSIIITNVRQKNECSHLAWAGAGYAHF